MSNSRTEPTQEPVEPDKPLDEWTAEELAAFVRYIGMNEVDPQYGIMLLEAARRLTSLPTQEPVGPHSPLPWVVDEDNPLLFGTAKSWYPRGVYDVVALLEGGEGYTEEHNAKAKANARLIVKAVNALASPPVGYEEPELTGHWAVCSIGRIGKIEGRKALPWGESWVGTGLDGEPWASRNPKPLREDQSRLFAQEQGPEDWEIRRNDDGSVDEIVGSGFFHLEQMDDDLWWCGLYPARGHGDRISWFIRGPTLTLQDVPDRLRAPHRTEPGEESND